MFLKKGPGSLGKPKGLGGDSQLQQGGFWRPTEVLALHRRGIRKLSNRTQTCEDLQKRKSQPGPLDALGKP